MRKFTVVLLFLVAGITYSSYAQFQYPAFKWIKTEHDFGNIVQQNPVTYEFEFTNKGQAPLVISEVEGSCGCTVTEYTKDPVIPGQKGKVKATFDAAAPGKFRKSIKVVANVEGGPEYLYIKGTVMESSQTGDPEK